MNNKKKAYEIAHRYMMENPKLTYYISACGEMAAWKEEQFTKKKEQWIDKACEWMKNNIAYYCGYTSVYEDNLIEKFKKAMEAEL